VGTALRNMGEFSINHLLSDKLATLLFSIEFSDYGATFVTKPTLYPLRLDHSTSAFKKTAPLQFLKRPAPLKTASLQLLKKPLHFNFLRPLHRKKSNSEKNPLEISFKHLEQRFHFQMHNNRFHKHYEVFKNNLLPV